MKVPVKVLLEEANLAKRKSRLEAALLLYTKVIYFQPDNASNFLERGDIYLRLGDVRSASSNYRKAFLLNPSSYKIRKRLTDSYDTLGTLYLRSGEWENAFACYNDSISLEGRNPSYRMHRCLLCIHLKQWKTALDDLNVYLSIKTANADAFVLRAKLFWKIGRFDKASLDFKSAREISPTHPDVLEFETLLSSKASKESNSVSKLLLQGDFHAARRQMAKALKINAFDPQLLLLDASTCRRLGENEKALSQIELAWKYGKEAVEDAKKEKSKQKLQSKKQELAKKVSEKIQLLLNITCQHALVLNDLGAQTFMRGDPQSAIEHFNKAILVYDDYDKNSMSSISCISNNYKMYVNRGDCYRALKNISAALSDYQVAHYLQPSRQEVKLRLSFIYNELGTRSFNAQDYHEAILHFTEAIEQNQNIGEYYSNRGLSYKMFRDIYQAHKDFCEAIRLDPNNQHAKAWLSSQGNSTYTPSEEIEMPRIDQKR